jgi:hypothetical protein
MRWASTGATRRSCRACSPTTPSSPAASARPLRYAATQHNITNQYVVRAGDDLIVHSYAVALHFGADEQGTGDLAMGVEYRDRATRVGTGWLVSHRRTVVLWTRRGTLAS